MSPRHAELIWASKAKTSRAKAAKTKTATKANPNAGGGRRRKGKVATKPPITEPPKNRQSLSYKEQETLTEALSDLPEWLLPGVFEILKKGCPEVQDDEDIDLDIDALDTETQRELQRFIVENTKLQPRVSDASTEPCRVALSFEEQEALSEAINCLPERFLPGVVEILQKAGAARQDDMELDLDIDELETKTQRELQRFVMESKLPAYAPRVSDASESAEQDAKDEDGISREEGIDLLQRIKSVQNQLVDLHTELLEG